MKQCTCYLHTYTGIWVLWLLVFKFDLSPGLCTYYTLKCVGIFMNVDSMYGTLLTNKTTYWNSYQLLLILISLIYFLNGTYVFNIKCT